MIWGLNHQIISKAAHLPIRPLKLINRTPHLPNKCKAFSAGHIVNAKVQSLCLMHHTVKFSGRD